MWFLAFFYRIITMLLSKPKWNTSKRATPTVTTQFITLLSTRNTTDVELKSTMKSLRLLILRNEIPDVPFNGSPLRLSVWKLLLKVYKVDALTYMTLLQKGESRNNEKISNDVFRTMKTDLAFKAKVSEEVLTRILNCFVWRMDEMPKRRLMSLTFSYVQGVNVLLAPLAFVMDEIEAYESLVTLLTSSIPLYVQVINF